MLADLHTTVNRSKHCSQIVHGMAGREIQGRESKDVVLGLLALEPACTASQAGRKSSAISGTKMCDFWNEDEICSHAYFYSQNSS